MISSNLAHDSWEIWFAAPNGARGPVQECGMHRERGAAERMAASLRAWLHLGLMRDNLLDCCTDRDDKDAVYLMREMLHDLGVDPAAVQVEVVPVGVMSDSAVLVGV